MRLTQAVMALSLLVSFVEARADRWFESYEKGRVALNAGQHADAIRYLSEAIEQKPESKASARTYGVNFIDYFPYLYRGIAYVRVGKIALALRDLQAEERAGEVEFAKRDTRAQVLLRQQLEKCKNLASAGEKPRSTINAPKDTATVAANPSDLRTPARTATDTLFDRAVAELGRGQLVGAQRLFNEVERFNRHYPGLEEHLRTIRTREMEIKRGIGAFLRGEYQTAIDVLSPAAAGAADVAQAHAFLGCSYTALFLLTGEEEESALYEQAQKAFRSVKGIDARYQLDQKVISPVIRKVYESVQQP